MARRVFGGNSDKDLDLATALVACETGARGAALADRLRTVLSEYPVPAGDAVPAAGADGLPELRERVTTLLAAHDDPAELLWLLHLAFVARCATDAELDRLRGDLAWSSAASVIGQLREAAALTPQTWATVASLDLTTIPIVDASTTASRDVHTGIQRVVREVVPRWHATHDLALAIFDKGACVWRHPTAREAERLIHWGQRPQGGVAEGTADSVEPAVQPALSSSPTKILVPWRTTVILPELAGEVARSQRLRALELWTPTVVTAIVHDLLPLTRPEAYRDTMPMYFARYVTVLRECARVAADSQAVANDLDGLCVSFRNQGLPGPAIAAYHLPIQADPVSRDTMTTVASEIMGDPDVALVLSVSSIVPRKNNLRTLQAAERLWNEGLEFELLFIAGFGINREPFDREFARLLAKGRPVRVISEASESMLWAAYRLARFTVFISIAEGYGLPAAESIAVGTPVVLSNLGSMAEIGMPGGAEFVDPHDLDDVTSAMRLLLTDEARLTQLRAEAAARLLPTWDDYATDTWEWLINGRRIGRP